jgi:hypothetical protein
MKMKMTRSLKITNLRGTQAIPLVRRAISVVVASIEGRTQCAARTGRCGARGASRAVR